MSRLKAFASVATAPKLGDLQLSQHRPEATGHSDPGSPGTHTPHSANKSEPAQKGRAQPPQGRGAPRGERRITVYLGTFLLSSTDTFRSDADSPTVDKGQRRVWLSPPPRPGILGWGDPGSGHSLAPVGPEVPTCARGKRGNSPWLCVRRAPLTPTRHCLSVQGTRARTLPTRGWHSTPIAGTW